MCSCVPCCLFLQTSIMTHEAIGELRSEHEVQLMLENLLKTLPDLDNDSVNDYIQHSFTAMVRLLQERPSAACTAWKVEHMSCSVVLVVCIQVCISCCNCHFSQTLMKSFVSGFL